MKIFKNGLVLFVALTLLGCQGIDFQNQLRNFTNQVVPNQRIKEVNGVVFEAKSCLLSSTRSLVCRFSVTSKFKDRTVVLLGQGYLEIQDDAGNSYSGNISFGDAYSWDQGQKVLIANTPYIATLETENISTQATKIRAIVLKRVDVFPGGTFERNLVFTHPKMVSAHGDAQKSRMARLETTPTASSQKAIDLSGTWNEIIFGRDMGVARIEQNGSALKFWNFEKPPKFSEGVLENSGAIRATGWNLTASLHDSGKKISWSNGVIWIRK